MICKKNCKEKFENFNLKDRFIDVYIIVPSFKKEELVIKRFKTVEEFICFVEKSTEKFIGPFITDTSIRFESLLAADYLSR